MLLSTVLVCLTAAADSPRQIVLTPEAGLAVVVGATPAQGDLPQALVDARKLAESLRYEEAVVDLELAAGIFPSTIQLSQPTEVNTP